jgi:hypothetical protein
MGLSNDQFQKRHHKQLMKREPLGVTVLGQRQNNLPLGG